MRVGVRCGINNSVRTNAHGVRSARVNARAALVRVMTDQTQCRMHISSSPTSFAAQPGLSCSSPLVRSPQEYGSSSPLVPISPHIGYPLSHVSGSAAVIDVHRPELFPCCTPYRTQKKKNIHRSPMQMQASKGGGFRRVDVCTECHAHQAQPGITDMSCSSPWFRRYHRNVRHHRRETHLTRLYPYTHRARALRCP